MERFFVERLNLCLLEILVRSSSRKLEGPKASDGKFIERGALLVEKINYVFFLRGGGRNLLN